MTIWNIKHEIPNLIFSPVTIIHISSQYLMTERNNVPTNITNQVYFLIIKQSKCIILPHNCTVSTCAMMKTQIPTSICLSDCLPLWGLGWDPTASVSPSVLWNTSSTSTCTSFLLMINSFESDFWLYVLYTVWVIKCAVSEQVGSLVFISHQNIVITFHSDTQDGRHCKVLKWFL